MSATEPRPVIAACAPGGWCLECEHPYDPTTSSGSEPCAGVDVETVRAWTSENVSVTAEMLGFLAETQGKEPDEYAALQGTPFIAVAALTECGETKLRTDVPSQAPVLPLATTPSA